MAYGYRGKNELKGLGKNLDRNAEEFIKCYIWGKKRKGRFSDLNYLNLSYRVADRKKKLE